MNDLQIFNNNKFGEIRTVTINNEPWFVAVDVCKALDIKNVTQAIQRLDDDERSMFNIGRQGDTNCVNEYGLYNLVLASRKKEAKEFKRWITHEVIPAIRKTGTYSVPTTTAGQIQLLAQGYTDLEQKITRLENDMPLFGAESDELSAHVKRRGASLLGGKSSEAYKDKTLRKKVFTDIYSQLKREFGLFDDDGHSKSYKALKRKELADAHEFIDCYELPRYLMEDINLANAQMSFGEAV